jgi:isopentenyldiphosphate isomerase
MRESFDAVGVITRQMDGRSLFLAQWNPESERYNFVAGHKHSDESYRDCAVRRVRDGLGLAENEDFVTSTKPLTHTEFTATSERKGEVTHYTVEIYRIQLVGSAASMKIDSDPLNRWLSVDEIESGKSGDGKVVSTAMHTILDMLGED